MILLTPENPENFNNLVDIEVIDERGVPVTRSVQEIINANDDAIKNVEFNVADGYIDIGPTLPSFHFHEIELENSTNQCSSSVDGLLDSAKKNEKTEEKPPENHMTNNTGKI